MSGCCTCPGGGVATAEPSPPPQELIFRETRQTTDASVVDVVLASRPTIGHVDIRGAQASSGYDDGVASYNVAQLNANGFLVNDGVGTIAFAPAFSAPATFGPSIPPSPAFVVVGSDLVARFTGLAGQTIEHSVVWERYASP